MRIFAVLVLVFVVGSSHAGAQAPPLSQSLKERVAAFQAAWNAHDAAAVSAFFAPDADQIMEDGPTTQGRAALQQWWRDRFATMPKGTSISLSVRAVRAV